MKALLVETDRFNSVPLGDFLGKCGWEIHTVPAAHATARFRERPCGLVLLAGSAEVCAGLAPCLRALPGGEEAWIVAVHDGGDGLEALLQAGIDDILDPRGSPRLVEAQLALVAQRLERHSASNRDDLIRVFERALRESEVRYRALFDQSPVGVFLCDRALRITDINERLRQITGLPRGTMVGMSLRDQEYPPVPGLQDAVVGETAFYDGPYLHPDGSQLWVTVRYAPLRDPDGVVVGGMGVVEDVSEQHRAEQRLHLQTAELERVNEILRERTLALEDAMQARTRLYTSMNHELRTPISAIMLYQELLMSGALGSLTPEQHQAIERSHNATRHLLELVCDILDLSKLEAGRLVLNPGETRLDELLNDLMGTMLPVTERYGSRLILEVEPDLPTVRTDAQRVRQILLNLISNAAKFGAGRPISVRCGAGDDNTVVIEVIDEGIGIAEEDIERIFDDFVQVGSPPETGTGLGLSISRRLASLLQGTLGVDSTPGVGSTFRLTLPVTFGATGPVVLDVAN